VQQWHGVREVHVSSWVSRRAECSCFWCNLVDCLSWWLSGTILVCLLWWPFIYGMDKWIGYSWSGPTVSISAGMTVIISIITSKFYIVCRSFVRNIICNINADTTADYPNTSIISSLL